MTIKPISSKELILSDRDRIIKMINQIIKDCWDGEAVIIYLYDLGNDLGLKLSSLHIEETKSSFSKEGWVVSYNPDSNYLYFCPTKEGMDENR